MTKQEIKEWILANCVDDWGNIDLINLDFSDFDGNVDISGMCVKKDLSQDCQVVGGDLYQSEHIVKGNLYQHKHTVSKDLFQDEQKVKGKLFQSTLPEQEVDING